MNTYIYAGGSSLLTMKDNDIKNFDTISNHYLNIDWAWVIEEDGTFVANEKEYDVKAGDVIEVKEKAKSSQRYKDALEVTAGRLVPAWLDVDQENLKGVVKELPTRDEIDVPVNEMLIVELYSK